MLLSLSVYLWQRHNQKAPLQDNTKRENEKKKHLKSENINYLQSKQGNDISNADRESVQRMPNNISRT